MPSEWVGGVPRKASNYFRAGKSTEQHDLHAIRTAALVQPDHQLLEYLRVDAYGALRSRKPMPRQFVGTTHDLHALRQESRSETPAHQGIIQLRIRLAARFDNIIL